MTMIVSALDRRTGKYRRGTSLVETIIMMTIASSLFLMATVWIHQSFTLSSKMRENSRHHDQLMRLSRQFRDDVHRTTSVESKSDTELILVSDDLRIEYGIDGSDVTRLEPGVEGDSLPSRERFRFKDGSEWNWSVDDRSWITLSVKRPMAQPDLGFPRPSDLDVRARLGRLDPLSANGR
ncbi:hypothetical protein [Neorhodopirellula pilleata]|uniref:Pseudopilin GspJ n=1 Tax=Neorhodopirellula pilleata TaxID=2714738 RepID=A0A5C6A7H5_9BACT|nr:hypothetical protein [Neorhodopirellula pilleata]TWT95031.1 hypothetical protein Pla100_36100 [Neorhodopirellula pilleata]